MPPGVLDSAPALASQVTVAADGEQLDEGSVSHAVALTVPKCWWLLGPRRICSKVPDTLVGGLVS